MNDAAYWERYDRELETLQKYTFGEYYMGKAAVEKSNFFIRRLLRVGSFAPPEIPAGGAMVNGPLFRPPCPVVL